MFRNKVFIIFFLFITFQAQSQNTGANLPQVISPSPIAASLGVYGQVPVSLFNGLPKISIPLGSLSLDGINVDIALNYHGGGIQPDQHPTWVGLGWDLNAGGVITRKINGGVDEGLAAEDDPPTAHIYYDHPTVANNDQWYDYDNMENYVQMVNPTSDRVLPSPDEFTFNFGGYAGSFYYDQTGHWQVKSETPLKLKILEKLGYDFMLSPQQNGTAVDLPRIFYEFDITTPDGTQYIFGGTPTSVEFSRPPNGDLPSPSNYAIYASAWYLTKIVTPNKREINFMYERDKVIVPIYSSYLNYSYKLSDNSLSVTGGDGNHITIINPCYLTSISTPNQQFRFLRSVSNERPFDYSIDNSVSNDMENTGQVYSDLAREGHPLLPSDIVWYKLDQIDEYNGAGEILKKISFSYTENTSTRLILNKIQESSEDGVTKPPYSFTYNTIPLPPYNSKKVDHWGYYNGANFFDNYSVTTHFDDTYVPAYTSSRAPNPNFVQAGILTSIQYPTGGKDTLEYEPNDYSKIVNIAAPQSTITSVAKQTGAGVRIHKISTYDGDKLLSSKEYLYVLNYNLAGTTSSGILGGVPVYLESANNWPISGSSTTLSYWYWYSTPVEPLGYTEGSPVTYSEVVEKQLDGSYTINNYSNNDQQQYRDQPALARIAPTLSQWKLDPVISLALDRGKLLEQRTYKSDNSLLKDIKFEYDTSSSRYLESVRIINVVSRFFGSVISSRASAYLIYSFPRFLTKQTEITYDMNGQNPLTDVKNFTYNNQYRQLSTTSATNSKDQSLTTEYLYPYDLSVAGNVYEEMVNKNMISPVIKTVQKVDNVQSLLTVKNYSNYLGLYLPSNIQIQNRSYPIENRILFNVYDPVGNILEQQKNNDVKHSYIWGYNNSYCIADVVNASSNEIFFEPFEESIGWDGTIGRYFGGSSLSAFDKTMSHTGKVSGRIDKLTSGEKYCHSSKTLNILLTAPKKFKVSGWIYSNGPSADIYLFMNRQNETNYFSYVDYLTTSTINQWVYVEKEFTVPADVVNLNIRIDNNGGGSVWFDDIRLYPSNAQMTTYTYNPLIGMTSQSDANNRITYYQYDTFGRLSLVRDQDNNIIKEICYNYAGQAGDCGVSTDPSWIVTGNLRCQTDGSGNTGYQEREEIDQNPNSTTFNQTRWVQDVYNTTACPLPPPPCTITMNSGFNNTTNSILNNGTSVSFYMVFSSNTIMSPGGTYYVANITGSCRPSATRTINYSSSGRNWTITIYPSGAMYWYLAYGSTSVPANYTFGTSSLTYNL